MHFKNCYCQGGIQYSYVMFVFCFFFWGGGKVLIHHTFLNVPPPRGVINDGSLHRKCSHAKQAVHTKSIRLRRSEENFHKGLSRITLYRLYYISYGFNYCYRYEINLARIMYAANSSILHSKEKTGRILGT